MPGTGIPIREGKSEERVTFRVPPDIHAELVKRADSLERSLNWVMVEAMRRYLAKPFRFPEDRLASGAMFRAQLTWRMPNFSYTETLVDDALTEMAETLRRQGAEDEIEVDVHHLRPFAATRCDEELTEARARQAQQMSPEAEVEVEVK